MTEDIVESVKSLSEALADLTGLMSCEDHGVTYVKRLSQEANQLYIKVLAVHQAEEPKHLEVVNGDA